MNISACIAFLQRQEGIAPARGDFETTKTQFLAADYANYADGRIKALI